jgi:hypothetical protein
MPAGPVNDGRAKDIGQRIKSLVAPRADFLHAFQPDRIRRFRTANAVKVQVGGLSRIVPA